jgi:hypothetical protein
MITEEIVEKIKRFPLQYQQEVIDFIDFIEEKKLKNNKPNKRKFGSMKGLIKHMSPDFDEPLSDLKDYM